MTFEEFAKPFVDKLNEMPENNSVEAIAKTIKSVATDTTLEILGKYHKQFILKD